MTLQANFCEVIVTNMFIVADKRIILSEYPSCYACDAAKTSMDHAPPISFFPKNGNYRKDLIKVPSCDRHNSQKSGDDEYARWHLATLDGINHCGEMVLTDYLYPKAEKDWRERGGAFIRRLQNEVTEVSPECVVGKIDPERMLRFLKTCAQAVYFFQTFKKLTVPLYVVNLGNDFRDSKKAEELRKKEIFFDSELADCEIHGANPEVFHFSICEKPNDNIILIRMVFYGALKHWIYHHPQAVQQYDETTDAN